MNSVVKWRCRLVVECRARVQGQVLVTAHECKNQEHAALYDFTSCGNLLSNDCWADLSGPEQFQRVFGLAVLFAMLGAIISKTVPCVGSASRRICSRPATCWSVIVPAAVQSQQYGNHLRCYSNTEASTNAPTQTTPKKYNVRQISKGAEKTAVRLPHSTVQHQVTEWLLSACSKSHCSSAQ